MPPRKGKKNTKHDDCQVPSPPMAPATSKHQGDRNVQQDEPAHSLLHTNKTLLRPQMTRLSHAPQGGLLPDTAPYLKSPYPPPPSPPHPPPYLNHASLRRNPRGRAAEAVEA